MVGWRGSSRPSQALRLAPSSFASSAVGAAPNHALRRAISFCRQPRQSAGASVPAKRWSASQRLLPPRRSGGEEKQRSPPETRFPWVETRERSRSLWEETASARGGWILATLGVRSEERRVGKECRSRWSPDHYKTTK